jgi:hypothetical protein
MQRDSIAAQYENTHVTQTITSKVHLLFCFSCSLCFSSLRCSCSTGPTSSASCWLSSASCAATKPVALCNLRRALVHFNKEGGGLRCAVLLAVRCGAYLSNKLLPVAIWPAATAPKGRRRDELHRTEEEGFTPHSFSASVKPPKRTSSRQLPATSGAGMRRRRRDELHRAAGPSNWYCREGEPWAPTPAMFHI